MGNSQHDIEFTLLGNGLDYVLSALEYLQDDPSSREIKYGILHLGAGIELVLKERLRREDWKLLFQKIEDANETDYENGDFNSVYLEECFKRLKDHCGITIGGQDRGLLRSFRNKRNKLTHFKIIDSSIALKSATAKALLFLVDFINDELEPEEFDNECAEYLDDIRRQLQRFQEFVAERWKSIEPEIKNKVVVTCPRCFQKAAIVEEGIQCAFCRHQDHTESAVNDFISLVLRTSYYETVKDGGEWPLYECPSCEAEALVKADNAYICFSCGEKWLMCEMDWCDCCGKPVGQIYGMSLSKTVLKKK